jgi:sterol desaturase/sphingolipid hydroxylase (fatty acid hydroxylase superfamily)
VDVLEGFNYLLFKLDRLLLSRGSAFSLTSLACALVVAAVYLAMRRRKKGRRVRLATILRALFPARIRRSESLAADVGYLFFNTFLFGIIFGWAILTYQVLSNVVIAQLVGGFGAMPATELPDAAVRVVITVALFLAYELAYWIDHCLSHRVPILWEFHKIHHEATVLTPLTQFRVHPVDGLIHANITAVIVGLTNGVLNYLFGKTAFPYTITDSNVIIVLCIHAYVHLQHSHLWIPLDGVLGRIVMSPAHHQVHHSTDPRHFNRNLGSCLAIWDWLFGTLYLPRKESEHLRFGVEEAQPRPSHHVHSIPRRMVEPFAAAWAHLRTMIVGERADGGAVEGTAAKSEELAQV